MLLDPVENTGGQFLETVHGDGSAKRLEQRIHDALKDAKLDLVRNLVLPLLWVVLMGLHYVLVIPVKNKIKKKSHLIISNILKFIFQRNH